MVGNTVTMFREAYEHLDEHIASMMFGMAIVVCAMISIPLAKKCERKTLLGISALGVCACLFSLGAFYYLKERYEEDMHRFGWVALVDFMIYVGFFMVSSTCFNSAMKCGTQKCTFQAAQIIAIAVCGSKIHRFALLTLLLLKITRLINKAEGAPFRSFNIICRESVKIARKFKISRFAQTPCTNVHCVARILKVY